MEFNYTIKKNLPPLSWLAIVSENCDTIEVVVGSTVETFDSFFVSGVWDGDFKTGDFEQCNFSCCTGAKLKDDYVLFLTPHHLNACIFSVREEKKIYLSNSLSFLLAYTNKGLDPNYYDYDTDFCCETLGERNLKPPYHSSAPLLENSSVNIYSFCKIKIDRSFTVILERRSSKFHFANYSDYYNAVTCTLKLLYDNSRDPSRKSPYGMIATISRGYDAPTCATFARGIGCEEAFSFNRPEHYRNDCGTEIAKILGYKKIHELDGDHVKSNNEFIEAADFASGDTGSMITFEGHKELFSNKLLFCGFRGDFVWSINHKPNNDLLDVTETSSENSYEVFLKSNTVLILIPYIGADHATDIFNISVSDEMKYWRLGRWYDRPICRRVVEEAGVGREMFGQRKIGSGFCFHYDTLRSIGKKMSPQSYQSLLEFSKRLKQNPVKKLNANVRFMYYNTPIYLPYLLRKFHINVRMKPWTNKHLSNPVSTTYILWGVDHMKKIYNDAISCDESFLNNNA